MSEFLKEALRLIHEAEEGSEISEETLEAMGMDNIDTP